MYDLLIGGAISLLGSWFENDAQTEANDQAYALQKEQMDFNKQRYDDWQKVYGTLQEDIGTYYSNLKGSDLSNIEVQQIQAHTQQANDKVTSMLKAKGINGSGVEASLIGQNIYKGEIAKATSVATAEQRVMQQKQGFLSLGLGQGNAIANSMSGTANNMSNIASKQGAIDAEMWGDFGRTAGTFMRSMNPTGGSAISDELTGLF